MLQKIKMEQTCTLGSNVGVLTCDSQKKKIGKNTRNTSSQLRLNQPRTNLLLFI